MATGFHGAHVIIGTMFLTVCLFRALHGDFTPKQHFGFEAAAWYWHFVDVVWLFLFICIYVWAPGRRRRIDHCVPAQVGSSAAPARRESQSLSRVGHRGRSAQCCALASLRRRGAIA